MCKEDVEFRTGQATGIAASTIKRLKKDRKSMFMQDGPCNHDHTYSFGRKKRNVNRKFDEFTHCAIRQKVHRDFFALNKPPTLRKLHSAIKEDNTIPNMSLSTLHRVMKRIGMAYNTRKRNSILLERPDITEWRHRYLRAIRKHRREGRNIVYSDETWCNAGHTKKKVWIDTTVKTSRQAFLGGLSTGLKEPSGKGTRLIITHAGTKDGFVPGAAMIFQAKKNDGDYHGEMNQKVYEDWFRNQLIPNIAPNSVIIIDNAPYHSAAIELLPRKGWRKDKIQAWLTSKNVPWSSDMIIDELLKLVDPLRPQYNKKKIDQIAKEAGHEVLRTPPYHCELNAIELVSRLRLFCLKLLTKYSAQK